MTYIDPSAKIGRNCRIGHNVYIGAGVVLGDNCRVQSGAVIGEDGFGYSHNPDGSWTHKPHSGGVVFADDVHIGANTNVHQGRDSPTIIGRGSRIDALVHVAHHVWIGENVMVIAGAELSGSVRVEDGAWIGPNACVRQHLTIGARALVGMGSVVVKSVRPDTTVIGSPARVIAEQGVREAM